MHTKESKLIKKYADAWCRKNGYPLQERKPPYGKASKHYGKIVAAVRETWLK